MGCVIQLDEHTAYLPQEWYYSAENRHRLPNPITIMTPDQVPTARRDPLEGKIIYVLIMTLLVQFLYPISADAVPLIQIGYQLFYMSLFVAGIYLVSSNRRQMTALIAASIAWIVVGTVYAFRPELQWANIVSYLLIVYFQITLTVVLLKYIFRARVVNFDVLLAACTVYLLLGAIFVPIYGFIETMTWFPDQMTHAFSDGLNTYPNGPFPWQTIVYYSYATLSTLGYGDVLPATYWARSVATLEAVIGVLYMAVIVARLVGLYAAHEVEEEIGRVDQH